MSHCSVSDDVPSSIRHRVHAQLIARLGKTMHGLGASPCLTLLAAI
jgi:hypothetical protein